MNAEREACKRLLAAWERTAAQMAEAVVRDPRTLELGAGLLRSHLLWKRAFDHAVEAWWAPFRRESK